MSERPASTVVTSADVEEYRRQFGFWTVIGASVWLVFLYSTLQQAWSLDGWRRWLGLALTMAFALAYVASFVWARPHRRRAALWQRLHAGAVGTYIGMALIGLAVVLVVGDSGLACAVYVAVAGVMLLPTWIALGQALVLAALAEILARVVPGWSDAQGVGLSVFLASFAVWGITQAMRRSTQLAESRSENAELLVVQERTRMARDLHDILGHSLTVITVKSELAGRLLETDDPQARARIRSEINDIERLSRDALADVRRTVEGYRDLSLPVELTRARAALEAAEISASLPGSTDEVPSQWRELFAWAVREGVTNVVRHSAARHCTITLDPDRVTIVDDGRGSSQAAADGGHGLVGLRERATAVGARIVVESPPDGGYSLAVVVPSVAIVADRSDTTGSDTTDSGSTNPLDDTTVLPAERQGAMR